MKFLFSHLFLWGVLVVPTYAYVTVEPTFPEQYEPYAVQSDFYTSTTYLGSLTGEPQLYEFTIDVSDTLPLMLLQRASGSIEPLGLLVVEVLGDGKGVREVARQNIPPEQWQLYADPVLSIALRQTPAFEVALMPGTYQVEVSAPDNQGNYALMMGVDGTSVGYFDTLGAVRAVHSHFGYSFLRMLGSSYIYWPLGIMLLLLVVYKLFRLHMRL